MLDSSLALLKRYPIFTAIFSGVIFPFGFAPFYWVFPSLISILLLLIIWQDGSPHQNGKLGFIYAFAAFVVGANWIITSIGTFGGAPMWLAVGLMLCLHSIMGLYFYILGYTSTKLGLLDSNLNKKIHLGLNLLSFASLWLVIEWIRSWFLSGFPWFNLGYLSTNNLLGNLAPIGGVHFVSFVLVSMVFSVYLLIQNKKGSKQFLTVVMTLFAGILFLSEKFTWTEKYKDPLEVALIQGGVSQDKKWLPEQLPKTMNIYYKLSLENKDVDLVVWPEAAIPIFRNQGLEYFKAIKEQLGPDTGFMLSSLVEFPKKTNGADDIRHGFYVIDNKFASESEQVYYKQHLVPYGEYFPVPDFVADWLMKMNLLYGDITPGSTNQSSLTWKDYQVGSFICYEDAYPNIVRSMFTKDKASHFLVNVTNDAWFSGSFAPYQHLQITQMRALEMQRPILRATNDGVTAVIDYDGKVKQTIEQYKPVVLRDNIQPRQGLTWYARFGNWPILLFCFLILSFRVYQNKKYQSLN